MLAGAFDLLPSHHLVPSLPDDTAFFSNITFPLILTRLKLKIALEPSHLVRNDDGLDGSKELFLCSTRQDPVQHSKVLGLYVSVSFIKASLSFPSILLHWLCTFCFVPGTCYLKIFT